jgi:hypothetical protein
LLHKARPAFCSAPTLRPSSAWAAVVLDVRLYRIASLDEESGRLSIRRRRW